ncbi:MAG TPA: hypothetical protein VFS43_13280 [Polyangiaceae bacterium]|nr:hypothetical protein [Polyangiaceae bacterium]
MTDALPDATPAARWRLAALDVRARCRAGGLPVPRVLALAGGGPS